MSDVKPENVQTWAELLRSFDGAKGHFAESYRHALLGVAETVRVVQAMAGEQAGENAQPIVSVLDLLRKGLVMWADRIPALLEASNLDLAKHEALITVKEVLLGEMTRIRERGEPGDDDAVRLEALDAILRVLDLELTRKREREAPTPPAASRMRRVVIE